jgi:lysophospholipase L1-like esterase
MRRGNGANAPLLRILTIFEAIHLVRPIRLIGPANSRIGAKMKKLFVIGDSISCYYGKYLSQYLKGVFEYDRKGGNHVLEDLDDCTNGINGGDSSMVLTYLKKVVDEEWFAPDILLVNCGLHDTKRIDDGPLQIPPDQYKANLREICETAKQNEIEMVWVRTTPLNQKHQLPGYMRKSDDIDDYNKIADKVMMEHNIKIIDLFTFTRNLGDDIYINDNKDQVHFTESAAALQAAYIAGAISKKEI